MSRGKQITILRYWGKESSLVQSMLELEKGNRGTTTEERWHISKWGDKEVQLDGGENEVCSLLKMEDISELPGPGSSEEYTVKLKVCSP